MSVAPPVAPTVKPASKPASSRLRWKLAPPETGLRAVAAPPRSSWLHDGTKNYACVSPLGRIGSRWYWVAGWDARDKVPHRNTCDQPVATVDEAKAAALAYVRECLAKKPEGA